MINQGVYFANCGVSGMFCTAQTDVTIDVLILLSARTLQFFMVIIKCNHAIQRWKICSFCTLGREPFTQRFVAT